jgi:hypothetical protein
MRSSSPCPKSATPLAVNVSGVVLFFTAYYTIWPKGWSELMQAGLAIVLFGTIPLIWDLWASNRTPRPKRDEPALDALVRVMIKQIGVSAIVGLCVFAYWLFPTYKGDYFARYFQTLMHVGPVLAAISPFYLWWTDRRMHEPEDGCYQFGCIVIGRWRAVEWPRVREYITGWVVKGFFWPLMFTFLLGHFEGYRQTPLAGDDWARWFGWLVTTCYLIDVLVATAGYMLTLRAADSHIRSTDPTGSGWVIALLCYPPFWSVLGDNYIQYDDGYDWAAFMRQFPEPVGWLWGGVALILIAIYTWATVCFGNRFSNLTYRGLVTSGPYRWTKHPAYVCKNLFWWLTSIPFINPMGHWIEAFSACCMLVLMNLVYYLRAKTEERHLMAYPEYRDYAAWVAQHGWIDRTIGWMLRMICVPFRRLRV